LSQKYSTIRQAGTSLWKEKGSKFYGFVFPLEAAGDIKKWVEIIRVQHPKATHLVYAYRMGTDKDNWRINDDGEPTGTAGKPILGQIDSFGLTNIIVLVARYFGGTKLGVSGLLAAYKMTAKTVLEGAEIFEAEIVQKCLLTCPHADTGKAYQMIEKHRAKIVTQETGQTVKILLEIPDGTLGLIQDAIPYGSAIKIDFYFNE